MKRNRVFLWVQAVLCAAVCVLLAAGAISIFRDGMAVREAGDAATWIYTREKAAEQFWRISPLIFGSLAVTAAGLILGIKDEKAEKPVKHIEITEGSGKSRKTGVIRAIILAAAAVCIIYGVYNGSMRDVFVKAANICTECIGLG